MATAESEGGGARRRFTDDSGEFATRIGSDVTIEGSLTGSSNVELAGRFKGRLDVEGLVWIHRGARFQGELAATRLVVEGELSGTITAADKVDLRATSRVDADITAGSVAAADGSFFEGKIAMTGTHHDVVSYREKREAPTETPAG